MSLGLFTKLPAELLFHISDHLPFKDRLTLASVHGQFRSFLIPGLFATLRITNLEDDEEAIAGVIAKYGRHVQKLCFQINLVQEPEDDDSMDDVGKDSSDEKPAPESKGTVIPDSVLKLLSGETLPKVPSVIVEFCPEDNFEGDNWGDSVGTGSIYIHEDAEELQEAEDIELKLRWRAALGRVWTALASNEAVTSLDVIALTPVVTSAWSTDQCPAFLGRLTNLSLDIFGTDNGAGWHSNTTDGYKYFLMHLHEYFFNHASKLNHLALLAHEDNPPGCDGYMRHAPLPFFPKQMPELQYLKLRNCFVDPRLVEFVKSHSKVLSSLILEECFSASPDGLATNPISWAEFYDGIYSDSMTLCELVVSNKIVPLTEEEEFPGLGEDESAEYVPPEDEDEEIKAVRQELKEKSTGKLFAYANLDDKYGMVFKDEAANLQAYQDGADLAAYWRLMERVNANAEAKKRESIM